MIDRNHDLPVVRQCQILSLARSTAYYRPQEVGAADLVVMRRTLLLDIGAANGAMDNPTFA